MGSNMRTQSTSFWGRSSLLAAAAVAGASLLTQVACSTTEQPVDTEFESAVTRRETALTAQQRAAAESVDPYCAILAIADDPHPPHGCHPLACEACTNLFWLHLCFTTEKVTPIVLEKYFGMAAGFVAEWGLMWAAILNVFATHASDFLCGPNSPYGMDFWRQSKCNDFGQGSQECQAANIAYTCSCMGDSNARNTNRSVMEANCGYCGCYKSRKYTGGDDQLQGALACLKKNTSPRPGRGRTFGDPNLTSFDGVRIADNRAGEFIGVRRIAGENSPDVNIHFRYEPLQGSTVASQVTAVAVKVGSTRVAVYAGSPPTVRVDGEVVEVNELGYFAGDLIDVYSRAAGWYSIQLPSGDAISVTGLGTMLNVSVELTEDQLGHVEGVLGVWDQDASDEPYTWGTNDFRVTNQADSLFDYGPGESLATFDDPTFPNMGGPGGPFVMPNPILEQTALATCSNAGIVDPNVLDGCVHDMVATNLEAPELLIAAAAMDLEIAGESPMDVIPPELNEAPPADPMDPGAGAGASAGWGAGGTGTGGTGTGTMTMSAPATTSSSSGSTSMFGMGGFPMP